MKTIVLTLAASIALATVSAPAMAATTVVERGKCVRRRGFAWLPVRRQYPASRQPATTATARREQPITAITTRIRRWPEYPHVYLAKRSQRLPGHRDRARHQRGRTGPVRLPGELRRGEGRQQLRDLPACGADQQRQLVDRRPWQTRACRISNSSARWRLFQSLRPGPCWFMGMGVVGASMRRRQTAVSFA